jgi:transposase
VLPSAGFKANRSARRARKRRRGRDGIGRRRQPPDVIVRCRPGPCRECGASLPLAGQRRVGRSRVVELPPVRPVVIEAWWYAARRRHCGTRTRGAYPDGREPSRTLGPGVEALLGYFHERHHVGSERLVEVCRDVFGLSISEGGIDRALGRLAERARPTYEALGAEVRAGPVIGSDEAGARVAGATAWHRVFRTPAAGYYVVAPRRDADVIAAFLGGLRPAGPVSGLWAPKCGPTPTPIRSASRTGSGPDLRRRRGRLRGAGLGDRAAPPVRPGHPPGRHPRDDHPGLVRPTSRTEWPRGSWRGVDGASRPLVP